MDPLTHTLTGAALGRAGLNRWCPRALPLLLLAANAPDIDIVTAAGGELAYLDGHRHLTHALVLAPLLAAAVAALVLFVRPGQIDRRRNWWRMWLVALVGVLTHLLLDWTNVYGIRLLLPFSAQWFRLDTVHIADPWIWMILGLAFAVPFVSRLVSAEIGAKATPGRGAAIFALVLLFGYEAGRTQLHNRAVATLQSRLYAGAAPGRVIALPDAVNPLRWTGLVETASFWSVQDVNLMGEFDPGAGRTLYKPDAVKALDDAAKTRTFERFLAFSQAAYWRVLPVEEPAQGVRVEALDLRFGMPARSRFCASALLDRNGTVLEQRFRFGPLLPE